MEVSSQPHASAALPTGQQAAWAPELVWTR